MWGIKSASTDADARYISPRLENTLFYWLKMEPNSYERIRNVFEFLYEDTYIELPYLGDFPSFQVCMAMINTMQLSTHTYDNFVHDIAESWVEYILKNRKMSEPYGLGYDAILVEF